MSAALRPVCPTCHGAKVYCPHPVADHQGQECVLVPCPDCADEVPR